MRIDLATNAATCLYFGRVLEELDDITCDLESREKEIQRSPLALLNIVFEANGSHTERYRQERDIDVCVMERETGTSSFIHGGSLAPGDVMNYEGLTRELHALDAKLLFLDGVMNWEIAAGKFIQETYKVLSELRAARGLTPLQVSQEQPLKDSLNYHLNLSSLRRFQAQTLQKRVQTQLGVVS